MTTLTHDQAVDLFRRPPDRLLDTGSGLVGYRCVGAGPDVLFVHGWPVSGATFRCLLPYLAPHVRCHLLDLPGAGHSRFDARTPVGLDVNIEAVKGAVRALGLQRFAVVGHDSGGLVARHALAGHPQVSAFGLLNTEQPQGLSWRFRLFLLPRNLPGFGRVFRWVLGQPGIRRHRLLLGDAFADRSLLDGEFDELFLRPLHQDPIRFDAALRALRGFDPGLVHALADLHPRVEVPVQLVWGDRDPFFPLRWAREMVPTFPQATLHVVEGAGLFVHEERPEEVARALLPTLTATGP